MSFRGGTRWFLPILALLLLALPVLPQSILLQGAEPMDESQAALQAARGALAKRDLNGAAAALDALAKANPPTAVADELERMRTLHNYLTQFWQAVDRGGQSLGAVEELEVGATRVAVVEYQNSRLVIRHNGENKRYTLADMPGKLVLALVSRALKTDSGPNKVIVASFLAVDAQGEKEMARSLLADARKLGVDVSVVEPELSAPSLAGVNLKIPPLTPAVKGLLSPDNWLLRTVEQGQAQRGALGKLATTTAEGHLHVARPAEPAGDMAVVFRRRVDGNFTCRVMLLNVTDQQQFGLFPADAGPPTIAVPLPTGNVQIQLARRGTQLFCEVNGQKVDIPPTAGSPRESGYLGMSLPAGQENTVAWFEAQSR